jgi:hypothetical protein
VAYIVPDEDLLTKADKHVLSYAELAALRQRAQAGDSSAAIALAKLPAGEQRLADMLVKSFGGKVEKAKKPKKPKNVTKAASMEKIREREAWLRSLLASPDPLVREGARKALGV